MSFEQRIDPVMLDCFLEGGRLPMLAFLMQIGASLQHLSHADTQKKPSTTFMASINCLWEILFLCLLLLFFINRIKLWR